MTDLICCGCNNSITKANKSKICADCKRNNTISYTNAKKQYKLTDDDINQNIDKLHSYKVRVHSTTGTMYLRSEIEAIQKKYCNQIIQIKKDK